MRRQVTGDGVEFTVSGLPEWHPYFEYLFTGFMKGAMELVCANPVEATRLRRSSGEFTVLAPHGVCGARGGNARVVRRRARPQGPHVGAWTFRSGGRGTPFDCEGQNQQGNRLRPRYFRSDGAGSRVPHIRQDRRMQSRWRDVMARRTSRSIVLRETPETHAAPARSVVLGTVISSREGAPSSPPPRATRSSNARRSHPRCA